MTISCLTPLADRHSISTVTLTPIGAMSLSDDADVHARLVKVTRFGRTRAYDVMFYPNVFVYGTGDTMKND